MSQVDFNNENNPSVLYSRFQSSSEAPGIVRWMMSSGVAKTREKANMFLLAIAIIAVLVAIFLVYKMNSGGQRTFTPQQLQEIKQMNPPARQN